MSGVGATSGGAGSDLPVGPAGLDSGGLDGFQETMTGLVNKADQQVSDFIDGHSSNGALEMSAGESLQLQRLMADESIVANASTGGVKDMADSIKAAARNI